jgi:TonB family protein
MRNVRRTVRSIFLDVNVFLFLLAGAAAIAQQTPQVVPGGDHSGSGSPPGATLPLTSVRLPEVLSDSMGVDFGPYLRAVLPPLRQNWHTAARQKGLTPTPVWKMVFEFTILKDGALDGLTLVESSGDTDADQVALDAITRSAPFAALPAEFTGQSLRLRCRLDVFFPNTNGATIPQLISPHAEPQFSDKARRKRIEGTVVLALVVTADGLPTDITVVQPLGSGLDEEAVKTVKQWRFRPAMKDGKPVEAKLKVEVDFHLYK